MDQDNEVVFIPTSRKGRKLVLGGYFYRLSKNQLPKTYWKCEVPACRTSAVLDDDLFVSKKGSHSHAPPEGSELWARKAKQTMKQSAVNQPLRPMKQIYNNTLVEINSLPDSDEAASALQSFVSMKSSLYRERSRRLPKMPKTRDEVHFEGEWACTTDGRTFLLASDGSSEKIVLFGTAECLERVCDANTVFMDGTFKVTPGVFFQLYTLHAFVLGKMFPLIFCLLPNKTAKTYERLMQMLIQQARKIGRVFSPKFFQVDFEMPMLQTIQRIFPDAVIRGCYFHFTQALWRHVQSCGLAVLYKEDATIRKLLRRIAALPLVPPEEVDNVWLWIIADAPPLPALQQFLDYAVENWIDDISPRFSRFLWTHWNNDGPRTTNNVEGWHSSINRVVGKAHPNVFELVMVLKHEQSKNEAVMKQRRVGKKVDSKRARYMMTDHHLTIVKQEYINGVRDLESYVDACSAVIHFSK